MKILSRSLLVLLLTVGVAACGSITGPDHSPDPGVFHSPDPGV